MSSGLQRAEGAYRLLESSCSTLFLQGKGLATEGAYRDTCVAADNANPQKMVSIFKGLTTSGTVTL